MKTYLKREFDGTKPEHKSMIDEVPFWSSYFGHTLLDAIRMDDVRYILDVGCATGFPTLELASRFGTGTKVFGIDTWINALTRALEKARLHRLGNVNFIKGCAESLPFENDVFNLVVSNNGFNNVVDREMAFSEASRILRKNAFLVFTENLPETMLEFYNIFEEVLLSFGLNDEIMKMKNHIHDKRKPIDETIATLDHQGFKVERLERKSFCYRFKNAEAMFGYFMIREFFLPSWVALLKEDKVDEVFTHLERRINEKATERGEFRLTVPYACFVCTKK